MQPNDLSTNLDHLDWPYGAPVYVSYIQCHESDVLLHLVQNIKHSCFLMQLQLL